MDQENKGGHGSGQAAFSHRLIFKIGLPLATLTVLILLAYTWMLVSLNSSLHEEIGLEAAIKARIQDRLYVGGGVLAVLFALFVAAVVYIIRRWVIVPVTEVRGILQEVGEGDLRRKASANTGDEMGQMGAALNRALDTMKNSIGHIMETSLSLSSAAEQLSKLSQEMSSNGAQASTEASVVSSASEQISKSIQSVAVSTQGMGASIKEIAGSAAEAAKVGNSAVHTADAANATVTKLGSSSYEVGDVVMVISGIARQTNLLALNATIEAARAGEAGRSFAVVANEVKELARETAKSTQDISKKIEAIQEDAKSAVTAIGEISTIIKAVNGLQTTIATSVEEQTAMASEMARNINEAAKGSSEIAASNNKVAEMARGAATGAEEIKKAAKHLADMAIELQRLVQQFKIA